MHLIEFDYLNLESNFQQKKETAKRSIETATRKFLIHIKSH